MNLKQILWEYFIFFPIETNHLFSDCVPVSPFI